MIKHSAKEGVKVWYVWLLGSFLFFSEYVVRASPSVILSKLMQTFALDAAGIGILSACFYYPYTIMQIPVGTIVDRYAPGRVLAVMGAIFAAGVFIFANANNVILMMTSRIMMGASAAFAFVGTLKLVTILFPSRMLGFLTGLTQALGMVGAASGAGPIASAVAHFGWRSTIMWLGIFILVISLGLFIFAWHIKAKKAKQKKSFMYDLKYAILLNKRVLINAIFAGLLYAPTLAFGEVWGVAYLESAQHFSHSTASAELSWIFIGWGVGAPLLGMLSDKIGLRKPILYFSVLGSLLSLIVVLYFELSFELIGIFLFLYGFANSGLVVVYAISGELNSAGKTGLTMAFTNMSSVVVGAICQPIIGILLVHFGDGKKILGLSVYSGLVYKESMLLLPVLLLFAFFICFFIQETNCRRIKS